MCNVTKILAFASKRRMLLLLFFLVLPIPSVITASRQFTVDYKQNCFLKDEKCFSIRSGTMHYIRVPWQYWEDRMAKFRAAGLNTVQTYIPWALHQPYPDKFNFAGNVNLTGFINLAAKYDLLVILRTGPYMDAEIDYGGIPWWLLKLYPDIRVRTSDDRYLAAVAKYFNVLLPAIKPLLYVNGGNVISLQVENEYGSFYACDRNYTAFLRDTLRSYLGPEVLLFTDDGPTVGYLRCGVIPEVFPTIDFGISDAEQIISYFDAQQNYSKGGPKMNSEFYPGWMDLWGGQHTIKNITPTVDTIEDIWAVNGSVNIYMFHGGTNFGYLSGAQGDLTTKFNVTVTSYDYDAPLSEAGDPRPKYLAIREAIEKHTKTKIPFPVPPASKKYKYGKIPLFKLGNIFELLDLLTDNTYKSTYPLTVEAMDHPYGFTLYENTVEQGGSSLFIESVRDRAYVFNSTYNLLGVIQRPQNGTLNLSKPLSKGEKLYILIENQGRICYGSFMNDSKGIAGNVTLDGVILTEWKAYTISLEKLFYPSSKNSRAFKRHLKKPINLKSNGFIPTVYQGFMDLTTTGIGDTFFDPTNWGKGQVLINGVNIGRYWPAVGPQVTLYVPGVYLGKITRMAIFELDKPNCQETECSVSFTDIPNLSGLSHN